MKLQPSSLSCNAQDSTLFSPLHEQLARATPGAFQILAKQQPELLPRVAACYVALQRLPRRVRRRLQWQFRRVRPRIGVRGRRAHHLSAHGTHLTRIQSLTGVTLLLALGRAPAATINVDGVDCALADAITAANTNTAVSLCIAGSGPDTLVLTAGSTHTLATADNSTYGATGLPVVTSAITIASNGSRIVRSEVTGTLDFRLLAVANTGRLTLRDLTLSDGVASGTSYLGNAGGGVLNQGTLTLTNSTISGNAAYSGGGVFSNGSLTFINSTLSGNAASKFGGGVQHASLDASDSGTLTFINSIISGNTADRGGGVHFNSELGGQLAFTNSTVSGNTAADFGGPDFSGFGGGVYMSSSFAPVNSRLTFVNSTVSGNTSSRFGGGVSSFSSLLTITNTTISGNTAEDIGGGMHHESGTVTLTNSTIAGNTVVGVQGRGGGVFNLTGAVSLNRTLVSGNTAATAAEAYQYTAKGSGITTANNFNLFGHSGLTNAQAITGFTPGATDITATSDGNTPTARASILNPILINNGGLTQTHALVLGSPATDAVTMGCPPPAGDQRGVLRPQDGNDDTVAQCDIGAFEGVPPGTVTCDGLPATRIGTPTNETINGTPGRDVIQGLGGNDVIQGLAGNDVLCGGPGNDRVIGGLGSDRLFGGAGIDRLNGALGFDRCNGGPPATGDTAINCEQVSNVP